jgi:hypothetical protein
VIYEGEEMHFSYRIPNYISPPSQGGSYFHVPCQCELDLVTHIQIVQFTSGKDANSTISSGETWQTTILTKLTWLT